MRIFSEVSGVVFVNVGKRIGGKKELTKAGTSFPAAGCKSCAFHFNYLAAFLQAVTNHVFGLSKEPVCSPGGTGGEWEVVPFEGIFYCCDRFLIQFNIS